MTRSTCRVGWARNENKHAPALFNYTDTALGVFYCFRYLLFVYLLLRMLSFLIYVCVPPPATTAVFMLVFLRLIIDICIFPLCSRSTMTVTLQPTLCSVSLQLLLDFVFCNFSLLEIKNSNWLIHRSDQYRTCFYSVTF